MCKNAHTLRRSKALCSVRKKKKSINSYILFMFISHSINYFSPQQQRATKTTDNSLLVPRRRRRRDPFHVVQFCHCSGFSHFETGSSLISAAAAAGTRPTEPQRLDTTTTARTIQSRPSTTPGRPLRR